MRRRGADLRLSDVRFTPARGTDVEAGLLGWASFVIDGELVVDGVAVRRSRAGRLYLSLPDRSDRSGRRHPIIRPRNDRSRRLLEDLVLSRIGLDERAAS